MTSDRRILYAQFDTTSYLDARYTTLDENDNRYFHRLRRIFDEVTVDSSERRLIDVGCGPSVMVALLASSKYSEIHLCDFAPPSITAVEDWIEEKPGCFDWGQYSKAVAEAENISAKIVESRTRLKIKKVFECDVTARGGLNGCENEYFDTLTSVFCLTSACRNMEDLRTSLKNMFSILKPGGNVILTIVFGQGFWTVNNVKFPFFHLTMEEFNEALESTGFQNISSITNAVHRNYAQATEKTFYVGLTTANRP